MSVQPGTAGDVNRWVDPAWARRFLAERHAIPHRAEGMAVVPEVIPEHVGRVLDLGTGDGIMLAMVLDVRPGAAGVALDFSAEMLGRARERFAGVPGVEVVEHDLDDPLPASLDRFDLVVSSFAIHHCTPERQRALYAEVFGLLEPGGMFANMEHVASPTPGLHEAFLRAIGKTHADDDPSNKLVLLDTQLAWLREIGFDDVDCLWKWRELALLAATRP